MPNPFSDFVKARRRQNGLTQPDMARKAGVGLRFVRDLEQGKASVRLDKVNQVLALFGHEAGPVRMAPKPVQPDSPSPTKTKSKSKR